MQGSLDHLSCRYSHTAVALEQRIVRHWEKLWRVNGMQRAVRIEEEAEARECASLLR